MVRLFCLFCPKKTMYQASHDLPRCVDFASAVLKYIDEDNSFLYAYFLDTVDFYFTGNYSAMCTN
jgi:hypothetical protein